MKKFNIDICENIEDGTPGNEIWDSDYFQDPIEAETEEAALRELVSVMDEQICYEWNVKFVYEDDEVDDDLDYRDREHMIKAETYTKNFENHWIEWKDLNGNEHTVYIRVKEIEE